jgi:hypothetical protein
VGGIADRAIQGKDVKKVLSPTAVAIDAVSGAAGGVIATKANQLGTTVANGSAKVAAASGDDAAEAFFATNATAIGQVTQRAAGLAKSTVEKSISNAQPARHCGTGNPCPQH